MVRDYSALHHYLVARAVMPFDWGRDKNDCISHAAGAVMAQTARDVLGDLAWTSQRGAAKLIGKAGDLAALISERLTPIAPAHAHRGDIGGVVDGQYLGGVAIVVIDGPTLIGPGGMYFRRAAMTLAWSID